MAVSGLQRGRSQARETAPVQPVPLTFVEVVLPFLRPQLADMVRLQLLTGMRPGELVRMRALDVDMTGKVWLYRPGSDQGQEGAHKTAHHGHQRIIPIGPRGQEIVRRNLKTAISAFLFSPREVVEELHAERRQKRKTKVQPSQLRRKRKREPARAPGDRYAVDAYGKAIARACKKADEAAHEQDPSIPKEQKIIPPWHPHQLRHTRATEIRREAGLDTARALLGHRSPKVTEVYAELDLGKACEMEKMG